MPMSRGTVPERGDCSGGRQRKCRQAEGQRLSEATAWEGGQLKCRGAEEQCRREATAREGGSVSAGEQRNSADARRLLGKEAA